MKPFSSHHLLTTVFRDRVSFSFKAIFTAFILLTVVLSGGAQRLTISSGGHLVLNGNVSLVINNAAFQNNGQFSAGGSTVSFRGHHDTSKSFVSGTSSTTFNNLSIIKSAFGVTLRSSVIVRDVLAVTGGNLYTDSNLTLKSDAALTARVSEVPSTSQIIGKANVQRYMPARRAWRLLTAPVSGSYTILNTWQNKGVYAPGVGMLVTGPSPSAAAGNGLDYSAQNGISMKSFNYATQQYVNITNTKVRISDGVTGSGDNTGYFVFVRGDRDPNNTYVSNVNVTTLTSIGALQTGNQVFTASPVSGKYTLIGNPYASPVDFNNVTRTNLIKRFYVWDPSINNVGGYVMLDDLNNDGIFAKTVAGSSQTKNIQSSQAFFVETSSSAPASLTFLETSKSSVSSNTVFRPQTPAGYTSGQLSATLYLFNQNGKNILADGVLAEFDDIYAAGINRDDALKFSNTNENLIIVRNNVSLAAERRPAVSFTDTIFFRLTNTVQREYQFSFDAMGLEQPGMDAYLEDSYLGSRSLLDLSGTSTVNFSIDAQAGSAAANRFRIVFAPNIAVLPVTISSFKAYEKNSNIQVAWQVENEINILKYEVEKSTTGSDFIKMFTVSVSGNNNAQNNYQWTDENPAPGNNFFRIKIYDRNGEISYTTIEKVSIEEVVTGIRIYPNPVAGRAINFQFSSQPAGIYQVEILNANGQLVHSSSLEYAGGMANHKVITNAQLATGLYQLRMKQAGKAAHTQQLIIH